MIDRYNTKNPIVGTLYLTATHLIFVEPETNKETWVSFDCSVFFFDLLLRRYVIIHQWNNPWLSTTGSCSLRLFFRVCNTFGVD